MNQPQTQTELQIDQARMLVTRLERVSVDSIWARRASGLRGALLHLIEAYENHLRDHQSSEYSPAETEQMQTLLNAGFKMLERAAVERLR
jgi:hypothetical protein